MYQEFKKKCKAPKIQRHSLKAENEKMGHSSADDQFCIVIPLKGNKKRNG